MGRPPMVKEQENKEVLKEQIDKKIEELQKTKQEIETETEQEISQFNSLYLFTKNSLDLLHNRIMQIELWIAEINSKPAEVEASDIPQSIPPIDENKFMKSEKKR